MKKERIGVVLTKLYLSQFDLQITHKPGKSMLGSDLLSRRVDHGEEPPEEATMLPSNLFLAAIDLDLANEIMVTTETDPFAKYIIQALQQKKPAPHTKSMVDWTYTNGTLYFRGKTYIPDKVELRRQILNTFHDLPTAGHPGNFQTLASLREHYYWPGMAVFVK